MKSIRLIFRFYRENWLPLLLLLVVTLFATSMLINVVSQFSYANYVTKVFSNPSIQNSVYYMPGSFEDTPEGLANLKIDLESQKLPGVQDIVQPVGGISVGYGEQFSNVFLCDAAYRSAFPLVDEGRWLSQADANTPEVEAVVSGYLFRDIKPGDEIVVETNPYTDPPVTKKIKVIGAKREPSFNPTFGYTSPVVTIPNIFEQAHNSFSICQEDADALLGEARPEHSSVYGIPSSNLLIRFKDSAPEAEIQSTLAKLSETGSFVHYEDVIKATEEGLAQSRKEQLPRPLIMLFVSTFSTIAIGILIVDKKLSEYRIYFLCGCSHRKGVCQMLAAISLIPFFAAMLDLIYIAMIPTLYGNATFLNPFLGTERVAYGPDVVLALIAYFTITLILSVIIPFFNIRKESAIQTYRRKT